MAKRITLRIEIVEPVSFSAQAVTTGGHRSLDHIPGAALLGLAAAYFYRDDGKPIDGVDVWSAFHSGKVRFGNGYPVLDSGMAALPVPRCLHTRKGGKGVANLARVDREPGVQYQQIRSGYVNLTTSQPTGTIKPRMQTTLKTAVDAVTGTAASAQLFGTQSIAPGQVFDAVLECEDGLESQLDVICARLDGPQRIGKSRSAEYGHVKISLAGDRESEVSNPVKPDECVVYCSSEIWLHSVQDGHLPMAAEFMLESGELDLSRSFISYRRYAPYNGRWRTLTPERQVVEAGSVLMFTGVDPARRPTAARAVVGAGREAGLGVIHYDPPCLVLEVLENWETLSAASAGLSPEAARHEDSPLWKFMRSRADASIVRIEAVRIAHEVADRFLANYEVARSLGGMRRDQLSGPGKTQWGQVSTVARATSDPEKLRDALFGKKKGLIPENDSAWAVPCGAGDTHRSILSATLDELSRRNSNQTAYIIELAARQMRERIESMDSAPEIGE